MLANAWTFSPSDALAYFNTDGEKGLTDDQVKSYRELYGENCTSR